MKTLKPVKWKLSKENRKESDNDSQKLLRAFFNFVVIFLDKEYYYES